MKILETFSQELGQLVGNAVLIGIKSEKFAYPKFTTHQVWGINSRLHLKEKRFFFWQKTSRLNACALC